MVEQKERRKIDRVSYSGKGIIVVCDTQEKMYIGVQDASPQGLGAVMDPGSPDILGKDVIIVTDTMIMYADVIRQEKMENGGYRLGIVARNFTEDVLQYLFDRIAAKEKTV